MEYMKGENIKVIKREGISAEAELSMKKFTGNKFEK